MQTQEIHTGDETVLVSSWGPVHARGVVLFCAGRGGDPGRHAPFLETLSASGLRVIAPHFEFLSSTRVTDEVLVSRARRSRLAYETCIAPLGLPCFGLGHSLGATLLLAHAGAKPWTRVNAPAAITALPLDKVAMLAPVLGFFQPPGSLDELRADVTVWLGELDEVIPPSSVEPFFAALPNSVKRRVETVPDADHFTFMSQLPPSATETHPDRDAFLTRLANDVACFFLE